MLSLKTNGLDKHAKGMSLHLGYFDTASLVYLWVFLVKKLADNEFGFCQRMGDEPRRFGAHGSKLLRTR